MHRNIQVVYRGRAYIADRAPLRRMGLLLSVIAAMAMPAAAASKDQCAAWPVWPNAAMNSLALCDQPAVERRIGKLCVRHEWRCGVGAFEDWLGQWLEQTQAPIQLERRSGQLIFSSHEQGVAWAMFWAIQAEPQSRFTVLLSRMRAQSQ